MCAKTQFKVYPYRSFCAFSVSNEMEADTALSFAVKKRFISSKNRKLTCSTVPNLVSIQSVCKYMYPIGWGQIRPRSYLPKQTTLNPHLRLYVCYLFRRVHTLRKITYIIVGSGWVVFLKSFTRPRVKLNWGFSDSRISSVQGLRRFFTPASSRVFSYFLGRFSRHHRTLTFFLITFKRAKKKSSLVFPKYCLTDPSFFYCRNVIQTYCLFFCVRRMRFCQQGSYKII